MTSFLRRAFIFVCGIILASYLTPAVQAQSVKCVVVMKGTVSAEEASALNDVKISVRSASDDPEFAGDTSSCLLKSSVRMHYERDTANEVTASHPNAATGKYLVVLKPGKRYRVHLTGRNILPEDEVIETPNTDHAAEIVRDFTVRTR